MRLVHTEALSLCTFAIPASILAGMVLIWILCAILRILSPMYFATMPAFSISFPSVAAGVIIGILTVFRVACACKKGIKVIATSSDNRQRQSYHTRAQRCKHYILQSRYCAWHSSRRCKPQKFIACCRLFCAEHYFIFILLHNN